MMSYVYKPLGDSALLVIIGHSISPEINKQVRYFSLHIEQKNINGVVEIIPAYADLLINYNPLVISLHKLLTGLKVLELASNKEDLLEAKTLIIPVCYEGMYAPDMNEVMQKSGLTATEIIHLHSANTYLVYMLGFTPGFCYLGGLDKRLATPRKATPQLKIPAGAVGIAGKQTGIYPIKSPGGWQIIGQTPMPMLQMQANEKFPVKQGDFIRFKPITKREFEISMASVSTGDFKYEYC